jgi:hypothetical protein
VLWIFFALKNPTASAGFEPANLGTKGQHATPRPPKPLGDQFSVHGHVGGIPHANLMLEEEGPNNTVFEQDGAPRLYFHIAVLGSKVSTEMD